MKVGQGVGAAMDLRRLKWVAFIVPGALTAGLVGGLHTLLPHFAMSPLGHFTQTLLIAAGAFAFSNWVFGLLSAGEARLLRRTAQLQELNEAAVRISSLLSLDAVLAEVLQRSRSLLGAPHALLEVLPGPGRPPRRLAAGAGDTPPPAPPAAAGALLATMRERGAPVRLAAPPGLLCVPVLARGQLLGLLHIQPPAGTAAFSPADEHVAMMLANLAAAAMENASLFDQLRRTSQYLERLIEGSQDAIVALAPDGRVQLWNRGAEALYGLPAAAAVGAELPMLRPGERTAYRERLRQGGGVREEYHRRADGSEVPVIVTLSQVEALPGEPILLMIAKDMTAHHCLEAQRRRLALLEERERIGMDLHDGAIQNLYAVGLGLQAVARRLPEHARGLREKLDQAAGQLSTVIQDLRSYILDLRPAGLPGQSLAEGLQHLAQRLREEGGLAVEQRIAATNGAVPPDVVAQLLHVAGEGVSNILRHSGATAAFLGLELGGGHLALTLRDNGRGLAAEGALPPERRGLRNIKARAALLGGECTVTAAPGGGTEIRVVVPLAD